MTKTEDLEARIERLEARVEALGRQLTQATGGSPSDLDEMSRPLYDALKEWRKGRAAEENVPVYVVFPDKALAAIAATRPADRFELLRIRGVADKRVEEYGDDVLAIVASHAW